MTYTSHLLSGEAEQALKQALEAQNIQYTHTDTGIVITAGTAAEINIAKSLYNAYSNAMPGPTVKAMFIPVPLGYAGDRSLNPQTISPLISTLRDLVFEVSGVSSIEGAIALETLAGEIRARLAKGQ